MKVPFDLEHWQKVAAEQYPDGLPEPHTDDPTQWLFKGNVVGSEAPLQVAVARLLGYRWPDQEPDALDALADADGIVCLPAVSGERPAAERLRALLAAAYGEDWSPAAASSCSPPSRRQATTLEDWLRDEFFAQHAKLFHNRPFIWHVWDGRKDGFSALLHYHRLDRATLEKLTYTHLSDWIERQRADAAARRAGAEARLAAAPELQAQAAAHPRGRGPLRHLRPLEAARRAAARLGARPRRRRAPQHPALRDRRRPAREAQRQVEQGPRQEPRRLRAPQRPPPHARGEAGGAGAG